eukprot:c2183_g1_i1.p1 GENE.c2183_g1_i1~~c2183_g1_i1.p1  ORF type:complete len:294 (-),score=43.28 c2183_g1_i1:47-928(-)
MVRKEIPSVDVAPSYLTGTIASLLTHITTANEHLKADDSSSVFTTPWKYEWVKMNDYIDRLKEWIVCGPESFVIATCLLKRLEGLSVLPPLTTLSAHRIFFTCLMVAVKTTEDETLNNADFSKVSCIQLKELNAMEVFVLTALKFASHVPQSEFLLCKRQLIHLDLLFSKAKHVKNGDLAKLGRSQPSEHLTISAVTHDVDQLSPKRYLAATVIRRFGGDRRNSIDAHAACALAELTSIPSSVPSALPSFAKRRISLEMFKMVAANSNPGTPAAPVAQPSTNPPAVFFRQDSA